MIALPDLVRRRAQGQGPAGEAWLAGLDRLTTGLAAEWQLMLGDVLDGASAALVMACTTATGEAAVLKIAVPGLDPDGAAGRVLELAGGRGYVRLLRRDAIREAILLEQLGPSLAAQGWSVEAQVEALCATLQAGWRPLPDSNRFVSGAEKAESLAAYIATTWEQLGQPCPGHLVDTAHRLAERRAAAYDPVTALLAHGDAHCANALLVPGSTPAVFKMVDPEGLFIEPTYDLGAAMRDWTPHLLADPLPLGQAICHQMSRLTGVPPQPIWEWATLERISTGLALMQLDETDEAGAFFTIAEAWAGAAAPLP